VLGTTLTPTVTTSPVTPLGSSTPRGPLPFTGGSDAPLALGLAALLAGAGLVIVSRRR
jgi:LPXTG-motif cell wall-anchored protein